MEASILEGIVNFIIGLSAQYPKLVSIFAILYIAGIALKVVREAIEKFILESPGKADDLKLEEVKKNPIVKGVLFFADLLVRFKKPEAK